MVIELVILVIGCLQVPALKSPGISLSFMCVGLLSDLIPAKPAGILDTLASGWPRTLTRETLSAAGSFGNWTCNPSVPGSAFVPRGCKDACLALVCFISFHSDALVLGPSRDSKLGSC